MWWKSLASFARAGHRSHDAVPQAEEIPRGRKLDLAIHIVGIGLEPPGDEMLGELAADLARTFAVSCHIENEWLNPHFALDPQRDQYYSTAILERLATLEVRPGCRVLGVSAVDLFVPILTFVFGEAQLAGHCAVVSHFRLSEPDRPDLLRERLAKEAVHELGHTFGLRHCADWNCVMSSTHAVERLDVKSGEFCLRCRRLVNASWEPAAPPA